MVDAGSMIEVFFLVLIAIILILALFRFGLKQKRIELSDLERFFRGK